VIGLGRLWRVARRGGDADGLVVSKSRHGP
jgi:hypothetical protein